MLECRSDIGRKESPADWSCGIWRDKISARASSFEYDNLWELDRVRKEKTTQARRPLLPANTHGINQGVSDWDINHNDWWSIVDQASEEKGSQAENAGALRGCAANETPNASPILIGALTPVFTRPRVFLAIIAMAGKVVVVIDCVSLYTVVIRIGGTAEYTWFSLGDPSL